MGTMDSQRSPDVVIAGGGIIGLALALELDRRGAQVTVLERGRAMQQASCAAAGMLAAGKTPTIPLRCFPSPAGACNCIRSSSTASKPSPV